MKKIFAIFLGILIVTFTGCQKDNNADMSNVREAGTEVSTKTDADMECDSIDADMLAYWQVLNSKKPFISANEGCQEFYFNEFYWDDAGFCSEKKEYHFMVVDMDGDGGSEVVLSYAPGTTQLLHYENGNVYSWQLPFRGMKQIHENGVYNGSSGADVNSWSKISSFDEGIYKEERLAYHADEYFEVEGKQVSEEEYRAYVADITASQQMEDYDLTEENLNKLLLGGISDDEVNQLKNMETVKMEDDTPDIPDEFKKVLYENAEFTCVTVLYENDEFTCVNDKSYFIKDGYIKCVDGSNENLIFYISIADMDGDGEQEIILTCGKDYVYVLHCEAETIKGCRFDAFYMRRIFTDGTFLIHNPEIFDYSVARIKFDGKAYDIEILQDADDAGENKDQVRYYNFFIGENMEQQK